MSTREPRPFAGYKFLIIEDEIMQAWRVGDILAELGGTVGKIVCSYDQGLAALTDGSWDCVIVDINLSGEIALPLAAIMEREDIPFIYCSAYADMVADVFPEAVSTVRISKPVTVEKLRDAVLLVLKPRDI